MREHLVERVHILKVYTNITLLLTWRLQSWHKGDCTASAHHHSLWQTAQCECQPVRGAQAVLAYLRDCPLTWRNTQIQMYWLWKWLESYNNCTFSTWKDKFLFNLLFCIPDSFCTFHDYVRGGTPFLASPDGPSLIFIIQIFEQLSCSEKQSCPETSVLKYFFIVQDFWATCGLPWKTECALNSLYWIYIFFQSLRILNNFRMPSKLEFAPKFFTALKYFYLSGFLSNFRLPWKTEFALKMFTALK